MSICPMIQQECKKTDCAWFGYDGQCSILTLAEIPERLQDMVNELEHVKKAIDGIADNV